MRTLGVSAELSETGDTAGVTGVEVAGAGGVVTVAGVVAGDTFTCALLTCINKTDGMMRNLSCIFLSEIN